MSKDRKDLPVFRAWLLRVGYREQTASATVIDVRQALTWSAEGRDLPPRLRRAAMRAVEHLARPGGEREPALVTEAALFERLAAAPEPEPRGLRLRGRARRKKVAKSLGDEEWQRLLASIDADQTPAGAVLGVLTSTGLRVGDVLRLPRRSLEEASRTGRVVLEVKGGDERTLPLDGAPEAWGRLAALLAEARAKSVALLVAPRSDGDASSKGAAYKAVERRLHALAEEAEVGGRVHLHRLRRTVGVQALRLTEDTVAVQQLLGHRSHQTTLGYLDEARPERVAELQRQVRERFSQRA